MMAVDFHSTFFGHDCFQLSPLSDMRTAATGKTSAVGVSGWWFGTFFIFPYMGDNHPLSYFSEGGLNHQPGLDRARVVFFFCHEVIVVTQHLISDPADAQFTEGRHRYHA